MDGQIDLSRRLELLGIDEKTQKHIDHFRPTLFGALDLVIENFYRHTIKSKAGKRLLSRVDMSELHSRQKIHLLQLFACDFDDDYIKGALHVGDVHYASGVAPYLYISGYNVVKCELIGLACAEHRDDKELPQILIAITKLISLDMDLALSAYTRDAWAHKSIQKSEARKAVIRL